jgi:hypothetical protein
VALTLALSSPQISPDGKRIVAIFGHNRAEVRDIETGQLLADPCAAEGGELYTPQLNPSGSRMVVAGNRKTRVWDIGPPTPVAPDWLLRLAEALSGLLLNEQGGLEYTPRDRAAEIGRIREELRTFPSENEWAVWGRWFLDDRSESTISPYSKLTLSEYIDGLLREGNLKSIGDAEQAAIGHAKLWARVALARQALLRLIEQQISDGTAESLRNADWAASGEPNLGSRISRARTLLIERFALKNTPESIAAAERLAFEDSDRLRQISEPALRSLFDYEIAQNTKASLRNAEWLTSGDTNRMVRLAAAQGALITLRIQQNTGESLQEAVAMARWDTNAWSLVPSPQQERLLDHIIERSRRDDYFLYIAKELAGARTNLLHRVIESMIREGTPESYDAAESLAKDDTKMLGRIKSARKVLPARPQ